MQELRQVQSRPQTLNGNNNAVSGNNAGTVDENGFSYRDLLQQFQDQSQNSAKKREQDTPTPSKHSTPIKETSAEAMLNNLSFMSRSYNAASRAVLGSGAGKNVESQKVLMGDFNDDGILDTDDVMAIQDHIVEKKKITDPNMFKRMDLNSDGEIDVFDLTKLTNTIIGREEKKYTEVNVKKVFTPPPPGVVPMPEPILIDDDRSSKIFDEELEKIKKFLDGKEKSDEKYLKVEKEPIKGDLNDDGVIDDADSELMKKTILKRNPYTKAADFDDDGKVTATDLSAFNQTWRKFKEANSSGVRGDINNDGKLTISDVNLLKKFLDGKVNSANIYNEDVNDDGELSKDDLEAVQNLVKYGKTQKPNGIRGDINNDGKVHFLEDGIALLNRLNGMDTETEIYNEDVDGNGVVDMDDFEAFKNLYNYGKMQEPTGVKGDINNDGEIDIFDVTKLNKYLQGKENIENIYNKDVNGDGVVDSNDVTAIDNLINYGTITKPEPPAPPPPAPTPYQVWRTTATARVDVYEDAGLTNHLGNEKVFDGDPVDVLDETDNAYLIRYGVGTYPNYSDYKERWIEKWAIDETSKPGNENYTPEPIPSYQPWQATIQRNTPAYWDENLTDRRNGEEVWVGDDVTILDENDRAYKMQYWSNVIGDYKVRWVSKIALDEVPVSSYQPWQAQIKRNTPAYWDENLTDRRNGEEVWAGDDVTILDETENAYKMQYWSNVIGDYKVRWVSKIALDEVPVSSYQPWQAQIKRNTPAYWDENLTDRRDGEEVWVGDNVTILDENDRAYKMKYWSNVIGDYKIRWVNKSAISSTGSQNQRIISNPKWIPPNPFIKVIDPRTGKTTATENNDNTIGGLERLTSGYEVVSKVSELLDLDLRGFNAISSAMDINDMLRSGCGCMVATIDGNTGESVYCFVDLTLKVCGIMNPAIGLAWAGVKSAIETYQYENGEKVFKTPYGQLLDMTGIDTQIYGTATLANNILPVFESFLGKNYAQKLVWMGESAVANGVNNAVNSLFNLINQNSSSGKYGLETPKNPFIGPAPTR